jgi:hypothetical protein
MQLFAALIYWVIVSLWLTVLGTIIFFYIRNPKAFGTTRLLLAVLAIDTTRNIFENSYFGVYFGSQYGCGSFIPTTYCTGEIRPRLDLAPLTLVLDMCAGRSQRAWRPHRHGAARSLDRFRPWLGDRWRYSIGTLL